MKKTEDVSEPKMSFVTLYQFSTFRTFATYFGHI